MGGRIALEAMVNHPERILGGVLLSANPGLESDVEREQRVILEMRWIQKIEEYGLECFLETWYASPLFQTLSSIERRQLIEQRKQQEPQDVIDQLKRYSLAKQKSLWNLLPKNAKFFFGADDQKFRNIHRRIQSLGSHSTLIANASHALHIERPKQIAEIVTNYLEEHDYYFRKA